MPRKSAPKRAPRAPRRRMRKLPNEVATLSETHEFAQLTTGLPYYDYNTNLARYTRATQVAQGYREYRITKVEYRFKPAVDTFAPGGATLPYLYAMIDKTGSMRDFNSVAEITTAGAKAKRLDDKTIVIRFKPATLAYQRDETGGSNLWAKPMVSPWLSCDKLNDEPGGGPLGWSPSNIDHLGLAWIVDMASGGPIGYTLEATAHFEFRKPSWTKEIKGEGAPVATQVE